MGVAGLELVGEAMDGGRFGCGGAGFRGAAAGGRAGGWPWEEGVWLLSFVDTAMSEGGGGITSPTIG